MGSGSVTYGRTRRLPAVLRAAVGAVAGVLLISQGGQIFAAPVTVPALCWSIASAHTRSARILLSVVLALTLAVLGWFLVYLLVKERQPWIVLGPAVALAAGIGLSLRLSARFPRPMSNPAQ